jgi:hypothetical protein
VHEPYVQFQLPSQLNGQQLQPECEPPQYRQQRGHDAPTLHWQPQNRYKHSPFEFVNPPKFAQLPLEFAQLPPEFAHPTPEHLSLRIQHLSLRSCYPSLRIQHLSLRSCHPSLRTHHRRLRGRNSPITFTIISCTMRTPPPLFSTTGSTSFTAREVCSTTKERRGRKLQRTESQKYTSINPLLKNYYFKKKTTQQCHKQGTIFIIGGVTLISSLFFSLFLSFSPFSPLFLLSFSPLFFSSLFLFFSLTLFPSPLPLCCSRNKLLSEFKENTKRSQEI